MCEKQILLINYQASSSWTSLFKKYKQPSYKLQYKYQLLFVARNASIELQNTNKLYTNYNTTVPFMQRGSNSSWKHGTKKQIGSSNDKKLPTHLNASDSSGGMGVW